jgi:protein involved in polysaccharide export with SLBB domain
MSELNISRRAFSRLLGVVTLLVAFLVTSCATLDTLPHAEQGAGADPRSTSGVLQVGELVKIDFSGPAAPPTAVEQHIQNDGTIELYLIGSVIAAGKTAGELQQEVRELYVPRYYRHLNVTVKASDRFYFVGGEVKLPNRQLYLGPITVTGAIKSSGDFTDFANKRRVKLIRADGTMREIDAVKAQQNPELDLPVYPGDRIDVPSRLF